jgi:hypothetical protein
MCNWFKKAIGKVKFVPTETIYDMTFRLHVCPDHTYFPPPHNRKEVGGCASGQDVWIKGVLSSDNEIMPESNHVLGHEVWHVLDFQNKTIPIEDPDQEESPND